VLPKGGGPKIEEAEEFSLRRDPTPEKKKEYNSVV
jgi:hypothetical protein